MSSSGTEWTWSDRDLRLLLVEDSTDDADLLVLELRRRGFPLAHHLRVETAEEMTAALESRDWDLVISDHQMPTFSAFEALEILKNHDLDIPFIIVSGAIGEDTAVRAMRAGAHDYILKGNLARLLPAIRRELGEAVERQRRREAEQATRRYIERLGILHDIDRAIIAAQSIEEIADSVVRRLGLLLGSSHALLLLTDRMVATRATLLVEKMWQNGAPRERSSPGVTGNVIDISSVFSRLQQSETLTNVEDDPSASAEELHDLFAQLEVDLEGRWFIISPVIHDNRLLGLMVNVDGPPRSFTSEQIEVSRGVANQLAVALQQAYLVAQIEQHAVELEQRVGERTRELREANEELEAFTYSVSHDLRAPLRSVQGYAEVLRSEFGGQLEGIGLEYLEKICDGARRMDNLIRDLLAYSQLRLQSLRLWPVTLSTTLQAVLDRLADEVRETGAEIVVHDPLPRITGDQEIVGVILHALLKNALTYRSAERPLKIEISSETGAGTTRLMIADNGIGIAPEYQEQIFRIFERLHLRDEYEGNGIGLALVRKGIERMGGTCGVISDGSSGSTFWLEWPQKPMRYE